MSCESDEQLLIRFVSGDRGAFGSLAERYELSLLGLAKGMLRGDHAAACDAVQDAWVRVLRFAKSFDGRSSVKTWLYRIVINQCKTALSRAGTELASPALSSESVHRPPAEAKELTELLQVAVSRLTEDRRNVVLLCYHRGMTHEQAAEILEIPVGTLKSRLHSALRELRTSLHCEDLS